MRHRYPVLRTGAFAPLYAQGSVYGFSRKSGAQEAIALFNTDTTAASVVLETTGLTSTRFTRVWPEAPKAAHIVEHGRLTLTIPAREAVVLMSSEED